MRIIHTSDWHIGKQLQKVDFHSDMELFFEWLIKVIEKEKIDVLLMSGDLFDQANPSQTALKQYYKFLKRMIPLNCKVVVTGGNHDSPHVLNAPKELLNFLDITVIGGKPEKIEDLFIEISGIENDKLIIAAIPFLRDKDIRIASPGEDYSDKIDQLKIGMEAYFNSVNDHYVEQHKDLPFILMGHLYASGSSTSDSEREIQIGNLAGVEERIFGTNANYVALGHIHKPQILGGKEHIRYCGSPIPLSFSEKNDKKKIIILDVQKNSFRITPVDVPSFRKLVTLSGTYAEVAKGISEYQTESELTDLVEIIIREENENIEVMRQVEELSMVDHGKKLQIIKSKIEFSNSTKGTASFLDLNDDISNFNPVQLFEKRLAMDSSIENTDELINAFKEILENLNQE